jgi:thioredoxin reductase (NADPH)
VKIQVPFQLINITGNDGQLQHVHIAKYGENPIQLEAERMLMCFGLSMNPGKMREWGLDMDKKHIAVDPKNMQTNIAGIYAIGDIATYPGKLKLIMTGFAEAALACRSIYAYLNPDQPAIFEHSTSRPELFA